VMPWCYLLLCYGPSEKTPPQCMRENLGGEGNVTSPEKGSGRRAGEREENKGVGESKGRGRLRLLRSRGWESPCVGGGVVAMIAPLFVCHLFFLRPSPTVPLFPLCAAAAQSLACGRAAETAACHALPLAVPLPL
jgi:hypothetical protein